ncbi:hypothetical protein [Nannocystis pusilla]|uniref:hypothetical protein n=1 Tax=Nannocystis pusilla TaxID=889268 RepID=UPI003B81A17D
MLRPRHRELPARRAGLPRRAEACGGQCYDPFYQSCSTGRVECAGSQKPCGDQCYDPATEDCRLEVKDDHPERA